MGLVVTVAQQKGGAGKTSLAVHLACAWGGAEAKPRRRIVLFDLDPQQSLTRWFELRARQHGPDSHIALRKISPWAAASEIGAAKEACDVVVVDSPPHTETENRIPIRAADIVVVPVQLSPMDVWASQPTLDLIGKESRAALVVLNRVPARARLAGELVAQLKRDRVPLARSALGNRVLYAASLMEGKGVTEAEPYSAAAAEIRLLANEVLRKAA